MKTKIAILVMVTSLVGLGCAKKSGSAAPAPDAATVAPDAPVIPTPTGPYTPPSGTAGNFAWGGTANFTFQSVSVYRQYTQRYINSLSQLSDIKINLNLDRYAPRFGGTTTIRYTYQGQIYEGFFNGGDSYQASKYNIWFTISGKKIFHGFFEDYLGAIIVVLDQTTSLNDGYQKGDKVGGRVYFKNFQQTGAPHPPTYCWFVSMGPYDCRAWPKGYEVDTKKAIYPLTSDGYTLLGTFTGLDLDQAFNGEVGLQ